MNLLKPLFVTALLTSAFGIQAATFNCPSPVKILSEFSGLNSKCSLSKSCNLTSDSNTFSYIPNSTATASTSIASVPLISQINNKGIILSNAGKTITCLYSASVANDPNNLNAKTMHFTFNSNGVCSLNGEPVSGVQFIDKETTLKCK